MDFYRSEPVRGVHFAAAHTESFKNAAVTVSFVLPLSAETASGYSLLSNLISLSTAKHPTMRDFCIRKDEIYALSLDAYVQRRAGEMLLFTAEMNLLSDSYALEGDKILEPAAELLGEMLFRPLLTEEGLFPPESIETEKRTLIEELDSVIENKPGYAAKRAREIMCAGEPFAAAVGGERERVAALTAQELAVLYRNMLAEAPVIITYAGDADTATAEKCLLAHLPFAPRTGELPPVTLHPRAENLKTVFEKAETEQTVLVLGLSAAPAKTARERAVLSVFDEMLGGGTSSRLFRNVRERDGLCYYCNSYPYAGKNVIFVTAGVDAGCTEKARTAIYAELAAIGRGDFTGSELENAKLSLVRSVDGIGGSLGGASSFLQGQFLSPCGAVTAQELKDNVRSVTRGEIAAYARTVFPDTEFILGASEK